MNDDRISELMTKYHISNRAGCRQYIEGFLESNAKFNIERGISDIADVESKLAAKGMMRELGFDGEPVKGPVIENAGDEFDPDEILQEADPNKPLGKDEIDKAIDEAFC